MEQINPKKRSLLHYHNMKVNYHLYFHYAVFAFINLTILICLQTQQALCEHHQRRHALKRKVEVESPSSDRYAIVIICP